MEISKTLRKRYYLVEKAKNASIIGEVPTLEGMTASLQHATGRSRQHPCHMLNSCGASRKDRHTCWQRNCAALQRMLLAHPVRTASAALPVRRLDRPRRLCCSSSVPLVTSNTCVQQRLT